MYNLAQIELTNACNLNCRGCLRSEMKRKVGYMDRDTFIYCLAIAHSRLVPELWLHNWGEPLLHPNLLEYVNMAKHDLFKVGFVTNGTLLTPYILSQLENDYLDLSWNASTPKSLKPHLKSLYKLGNKQGIDLRFRSVVFSQEEHERLDKELEGFKVRWQRGMITDKTWTRDCKCPAREKVFVIYWDGTEVMCCRMTNSNDQNLCVNCREVQGVDIKEKLV